MGSDDLPAQVGEVRGRLSALEARMDRSEHTTEKRLASMDDKLDIIVSRMDRHDGAAASSEAMSGWGKALLCGGGSGFLVWLAQHFGLK